MHFGHQANGECFRPADLAGPQDHVERPAGTHQPAELRRPTPRGNIFSHSFHIHGVQFKIVARNGSASNIKNYEQGWKDTIYIPIRESVTFVAQFNETADDSYPFMYHCHMVNVPRRRASGYRDHPSGVVFQVGLRPSRRLRGYAQLHAGLLLKSADNIKKVLSAWVALRGEHPMQALAGLVDRLCQTLEAHGRVDKIAQDSLAGNHIARQECVDRFGEQRLAESRVALGASQNGCFEISSECHVSVS
jgi:hypothetical protein